MKRQKITPNPAISAVSVARRTATPETPSERARIRAATVAQQQRDERIRTEALKIIAPAPTLREELTQQRRREIGAPMATRRAPRRALIWWTAATVCSIAAAVTLLAGAL